MFSFILYVIAIQTLRQHSFFHEIFHTYTFSITHMFMYYIYLNMAIIESHYGYLRGVELEYREYTLTFSESSQL